MKRRKSIATDLYMPLMTLILIVAAFRQAAKVGWNHIFQPMLSQVTVAGFDFGVLIGILSNPATLSLLAFVGTTIYTAITKKNADRDRWQAIIDVAMQVVADIYSKLSGISGKPASWQDVLPQAMKQIEQEVKANPAIKSLTSAEVEKLKPWVSLFAQRKNGVLPVPMTEDPTPRFFPAAK